MVINTNTASTRGARYLGEASDHLQKSLARLSSGSKIVEPQDDAAGMAVASRMDAQINRNEATRANIGNAISFKQTQDGFLTKVSKALDRMSELSTLAQDGTKTDTDRALYDKEYQSLWSYTNVIKSEKFNDVGLFGTTDLVVRQSDTAADFSSAAVGIDISSAGNASGTIGIGASGSISTALTAVKNAITAVATSRATIGSDLSRLMMTNDHLSVLSENLSASVSRIKDVDVASESAKYAKYNILVQSGTAMLAQANSLPQSALRLLQ